MPSERPDFEAWFPLIDGFPRPDWKTIRDWIALHAVAGHVEAAWEEITRTWLEKTCEQLGGTYTTGESAHFLLLSEQDERGQQKATFSFLEGARARILRTLGDIAPPPGHGKHVVLRFSTPEEYYRYIAYFDPEGDYAGSSGRFITRGGYLHIAYPHFGKWTGDRAVLSHELTHNLLRDLPLPRWLNEALAMLFEHDLAGGSKVLVTRELAARHHAYWNAQTIQEFWRGASFSQPDGQELAYALARILLDFIRSDLQPAPADFREFVQHAQAKDAGEAAARNFLGVEMSDLVAAFLGPGKWAPKPG